MNQKETLIKEITELPDFMISRLLDIVHYIKLGIEFDFMPQTDNEFYKSLEFRNIFTESISEYRQGKAEDTCAIEDVCVWFWIGTHSLSDKKY